jgi:carboxyl-terminal processing protease
LKNGSAPEGSGSIAYVPKEKEKDNQLKAAIDLLHGKLPGIEKTPLQRAQAAPDGPSTAVMQHEAASGG